MCTYRCVYSSNPLWQKTKNLDSTCVDPIQFAGLVASGRKRHSSGFRSTQRNSLCEGRNVGDVGPTTMQASLSYRFFLEIFLENCIVLRECQYKNCEVLVSSNIRLKRHSHVDFCFDVRGGEAGSGWSKCTPLRWAVGGLLSGELISSLAFLNHRHLASNLRLSVLRPKQYLFDCTLPFFHTISSSPISSPIQQLLLPFARYIKFLSRETPLLRPFSSYVFTSQYVKE